MKRPASQLSPAERLGNLWGVIYVAILLVLLVTLLGKAFLSKGP